MSNILFSFKNLFIYIYIYIYIRSDFIKILTNGFLGYIWFYESIKERKKKIDFLIEVGTQTKMNINSLILEILP